MKTKEELIAAISALEGATDHFTKDDGGITEESMAMMAATDALKWAAGYRPDSERLMHFYKSMDLALEIAKS